MARLLADMPVDEQAAWVAALALRTGVPEDVALGEFAQPMTACLGRAYC